MIPGSLPRWVRADLRAMPSIEVPVSGGAGVAGRPLTGFAAHRRGPARGSIVVPVVVFVVAFIWRWRQA